MDRDLVRPDRVRGAVGMSVPYGPRGEISLLSAMRERFGDSYYMQYSQEDGPADRELARDVPATFRGAGRGAAGRRAPGAAGAAR